MDPVELRRIGPQQRIFTHALRCFIRPEVLEEVHSPRQPMPPHKDLIQVPLVSAVVRHYVPSALHQGFEHAVGWLDDHDARVEDDTIIADCGDLGEFEEEVKVAEDDYVGVDEDDLVIVCELPEAELAVVVLVVGVLLGAGVADAGDEVEFPAGCSEGV